MNMDFSNIQKCQVVSRYRLQEQFCTYQEIPLKDLKKLWHHQDHRMKDSLHDDLVSNQ